MNVENGIVYRVVDFDVEIEEGVPALPSKCKAIGDYKKRIEETLEKHRPNGFPQRDSCLYVCFSKENAYEWARIMYGHKITPYKLLTLDICGNLFWLKASCYNALLENDSQDKYDKAGVDYWNSLIEDEGCLTLNNEYEGLFVGGNKIIAIEYKNYINGVSLDIE